MGVMDSMKDSISKRSDKAQQKQLSIHLAFVIQ